jgi:hypothetical protein
MSGPMADRWLKLGAVLVATAAMLLPTVSSQAIAATKTSGAPRVSTGGVGHVRGGSGLLEGTINPRGLSTTYSFQYGPTVAYGSQTPTATLPAGTSVVKVGQTVTGLVAGEHYRLVATNSAGTSDGRDRTYSTTKLKSKISLVKPTQASPYGSTLTLSGSISGTGNADRQVVLQVSPFPYLAAFVDVGAPILTNALGGFSFTIPAVATSAQYRVSALGPRPSFSPPVTDSVATRVVLKVRSTAVKGLVRLYGTVAPAKVGVHVLFQLSKPARPGNSEKASERTSRYATQFSTVTKRATKALSRFSTIVSISAAGRYRAYVQLSKKGPLSSGSSASVVLSAAPAKHKAARKGKS